MKIGITDQMHDGTKIKVEKTVVHEDFGQNHNGVLFNDIALLRLSENIEFRNHIHPICTPFIVNNYTEPSLGTYFTLAGWGQTSNVNISRRLRKVDVPFVSMVVCKLMYVNKFDTLISNANICAGGVIGKDSCNGDSGGPLMRKIDNFWVLEGIISFGGSLDCGSEFPTVHVFVKKYEEWIKFNIHNPPPL